MADMKYFKNLRDIFSLDGWIGASENGSISEETDLANDVEELDRTNPGWDRQNYVENAARMMRSGKDEERIANAVYPEDVLSEARELNAKRPPELKK
jgi:hypothetical protein